MHPIGSYYLSDESTSPASLFGGTWERIENKVLIGAGDLYSAKQEKATGATHQISVAEMPKHSHSFTGSAVTGGMTAMEFSQGDNTSLPAPGGTGPFTVSGVQNYWSATGTSKRVAEIRNMTFSLTPAGSILENGSGQSYDNLPPYRAVYIWRRKS